MDLQPVPLHLGRRHESSPRPFDNTREAMAAAILEDHDHPVASAVQRERHMTFNVRWRDFFRAIWRPTPGCFERLRGEP